MDDPKFSGILAGGGGQQESGETSGVKPDMVPGEDQGIRLGGSGMQTRVGGGPGLGLKHVSHEDLSRHHCVVRLKAHEAHFSRVKMMETAVLTGAAQVFGKLRTHSGASQAPNEYCENQIGNSCAIEGGR